MASINDSLLHEAFHHVVACDWLHLSYWRSGVQLLHIETLKRLLGNPGHEALGWLGI